MTHDPGQRREKKGLTLFSGGCHCGNLRYALETQLAAQLTQAAAPMDYDGEDAARRQARRATRWSPASGP